MEKLNQSKDHTMSVKPRLMAFGTIMATAICLLQYLTAFAGSITYDYDELNRLKWARYDNGTIIAYNYGEVGNRTQEQTYSLATTSYMLSVQTFGCGTISPSAGEILVNSGSSPTFNFQAISGNYLENVLVDGVPQGAVPSYLFNNVTENHDLSVRFSSNVPDGDVSLDGFVTQADADLALRIALGLVIATPQMLARGDVQPFINGMPAPNGMIDIGDLIVISQKLAGNISWPSECVSAQTVQTITNLPVRIANNPASYFRTLQSAYNAATNNVAVQATNSGFIENANFNRNVSVFLDGGYGSDYATNPDYTTINGTMTITNGSVTVNNIVVR